MSQRSSEKTSAAHLANMNTALSLDISRVLDTLMANLNGMAYRCRLDAQWTMRFVSQGCLDLTGYAPEALVDNKRLSWEDITLADDRLRVREEISAAVAANRHFAVEYRILTCAGQEKWVLERGMAVLDECGEQVLEGFIEDVSERRQALDAVANAELRYRHIFEHASEGIFQTTPDGHYLSANMSLARLYGYTSPEELIADLADIERRLYVDPVQREKFRCLMDAHGEVVNFESEVYRRDGSKIWISENAHSVRGLQGELICYEGTVQDITERRSYQEQLERQANFDQLTGLPNRNLLNDRLEQAISRAARRGYFLALVFIDLDNFKFINDSLGHVAGDELLVEVAHRLRNCLRTVDTVARQGGDEFVLVLNDHYQVASIISLLERILQEISRSITLMGRDWQVGASLGVALYPTDGEDTPTLLKHADVAMYAAKARGRNNFQFFTHEMNRISDERLRLEAAMRVALEQDGFSIAFQPKVDHRRRIVGAEALARWHTKDFGTVPPDCFIPIAEETGLIVPLTEIILRKAFAAASKWSQTPGHAITVAVNLSPRLFLDGKIVEHVARLISEAGLPPEHVELEITESIFLGDSGRTLSILKGLKQLGVALVMDDFGTGYSSLSYIRRFPLDIIKIDKSLVTGIEYEDDGAMIARAIISLCQSLRKTVVAEGLENQAQFDFLRYQGCDEFQGYLISKPLPEQEFADLLIASGGQL
ncbi:diguanylate cyclase [Rugosibacter aromaticivorans]|uniref:Diguanylate cyclase n=2 Tax=Rugosibacter aromaticivorans TaxID=1565605 RepID=A0A0C5J8U6_9PROT|nr:diguanylate cyclase [Rugosibacter aromaticivorans]